MTTRPAAASSPKLLAKDTREKIKSRMASPEWKADAERRWQDLWRQIEAAREHVESNLGLQWPDTREGWEQLAFMAMPQIS